MLNKNSHIPIYIQICDIFFKMIEKGELKPGEVIPSENEIALEYKVSRMTAKKAVDNLMLLGKVERLRGKGTFVRKEESKIELPLNKLRSFTAKVKELNKIPMNKVLVFKEIKATKEISELLKIKNKDSVYYIERLRLVDNVPAVFEQSYIPKYLFLDLKKEFLLDSKFKYVQSKGYEIGKSEREIEAKVPSEYIAKVLEIKRMDPILYARTLTSLVDGKILEYSLISYNQKKYKFKITVNVK